MHLHCTVIKPDTAFVSPTSAATLSLTVAMIAIHLSDVLTTPLTDPLDHFYVYKPR